MQKNLEQQIKNICFWAFRGFFWYLVISFFLLSDYPIQEQPFNHKKAYEVIKDALGLVAAFVAPAIAVILFRDWREEHASVKNERISLDVQDLLRTTIASVQTFKRNEDNSELFQADIKLYFQNMRALDRLESEIIKHNSLAVDYASRLNKINGLVFMIGVLWREYSSVDNTINMGRGKWAISSEMIEISVDLQKQHNSLDPLLVIRN